jgi:hypothetical protein
MYMALNTHAILSEPRTSNPEHRIPIPDSRVSNPEQQKNPPTLDARVSKPFLFAN